MSRRPSCEPTERQKLGKPHDVGHGSVTHVRNSVSFLNPDLHLGVTNLDRAPSLNRLHAQSSTETSGLGETVTSGFSSQESVLSYIGDERDRSGVGVSFIDRSRKRTAGSPGGGRAVIEHELVTKDVGSNFHSGLTSQHLSKHHRQQEQYLTIPQPGQHPGHHDPQGHHEHAQRSNYELHSPGNQQTTARHQKQVRDSGGRSLTPQEAKDEYDQRQRRLKQTQRKREAEVNSSTSLPDSRRSSAVSTSLEKQKPNSGHRHRETDHTDPQNPRDIPLGVTSGDSRRRSNPSSNNRGTGDIDSKIEDYHQNSKGDRLNRASAPTGKSKQRSKEISVNRSVPVSSAGSRDSLAVSSDVVPTSGSIRSDTGSNIRVRGSSDITASGRDRRSNSRDEIVTHSSNSRTNSDEYQGYSSSSKSFESQISVSKAQNSKLSSVGESNVGNPRKVVSYERVPALLVHSDQTISRNPQHRPADVTRSLPKLPDGQTARVKSSAGNVVDDGPEPRAHHRNVHSSSKGGKVDGQLLADARSSYTRQRSEPLELVTLQKEPRGNERSKSLDGKNGGGSSSGNGGTDRRHSRLHEEEHREGQVDSAPGGSNASRKVQGSTRGTPRKVRVSDAIDIDLGPVLTRRTDYTPRDTQHHDTGTVGDRPVDVSRHKHSRDRIEDSINWSADTGTSRGTTGISHSGQALSEKRHEVDPADVVQGRSQRHRASENSRVQSRDRESVNDGRDGVWTGRESVRRDKDGVRSERDGVRGDRETIRGHRDGVRSERDGVRGDREGARSERDGVRSDKDRASDDRETIRGHRDGVRSERDGVRGDRDGVRDDRDGARKIREGVRSDRDQEDEKMNYERLFHDASRGMNGSRGGGGNRTHPAAPDGGYSSPPTGRVGVGLFGQNYNNMSKSSQVRDSAGVPSSPVPAGNMSSSHGHRSSVPDSASIPKLPVPAAPAITVKLTSPDDTGLKIDNVEVEWERRDSKSSIRSHTSKGSSRFLGINSGSAWAKWSRERRASYRRRIEKMEQAEAKTTTDTVRVSTPIKKARQEGLKFIHPDLEATYLSEDDLNELRRHKQQQVHAMRVIEKSRRHKFRAKNEVKMTPEEWHLLQEFWNHSVFVRTRFLGILVSLLAFIFMIVSITNQSWLKHSAWNLTIVEGLWLNCTQSTVIPGATQACHATNGRSWQNGAIGLMIFAATLGFLASILSICGVFTNPLPRKMYYFHSAGEVFFICALSACMALIVFPIAVEVDETIHSHSYGPGYGLGWAGTFFFLAAAICLSLDDLVRESSRAKCCRWCWKGRHSDRNELRQV